MSEDLATREGKDFRAPDVHHVVSKPKLDKDYEYRVRAFMSEDLRFFRDDAGNNPEDESAAALLKYAELAQSDLVKLSGPEHFDPEQVAIGLGFIAGRAERMHLSMEEMAIHPDSFNADSAKKLRGDYQTARTMIIKTGKKLFADADTTLSSQNYDQIIAEVDNLTGDEGFGISSIFKEGLSFGGIEYFLTHPSKKYAINLESHLGELQFQLESEIEGYSSQLVSGVLSPENSSSVAILISEKSRIVYQLQAMRNSLNRQVFGRENILPNEIRELQQTRENVKQIPTDQTKGVESGQYMQSSGETVPITRETKATTEPGKLRPDFELITTRVGVPLEDWTNDEINNILLPQLKKGLAAQMGAGKLVTGGMRSEARINDLRTDILNVEQYLRIRTRVKAA
ncbi:MAG: hypothetical protein WC451_05900 [Patescibacteria group bacterium]|jgi:hypothetical protein